MEGLFAHFFSADRPGYHEEDREWFLQLANQQDDWCVPNVSDQIVEGTSDQDLLDELQKSLYEMERARTATLTVEVCVFMCYLCTYRGILNGLALLVHTSIYDDIIHLLHCRCQRVPSACAPSKCTSLDCWESVIVSTRTPSTVVLSSSTSMSPGCTWGKCWSQNPHSALQGHTSPHSTRNA